MTTKKKITKGAEDMHIRLMGVIKGARKTKPFGDKM
jgi:hypothetical protein